MTPQKAIKQLDKMIVQEQILKKWSTMGELQHIENIKALRLAKKALEKSIPHD